MDLDPDQDLVQVLDQILDQVGLGPGLLLGRMDLNLVFVLSWICWNPIQDKGIRSRIKSNLSTV